MLPVTLVFAAVLVARIAARDVQFSYLGCFVESSNREFNGLKGLSSVAGLLVDADGVLESSINSREFCGNICSLGGFLYFGLQYGSQCVCGNSYGKYGNASEGDCLRNCAGNSAQKCGGGWRNSVFSLTYPNRKFFAESERTNLTAESRQQIFWTVNAEDKHRCLVHCDVKPWNCQAVLFSRPQQLCYLFRFIYPPGNMSDIAGDFFTRG